VKILCIIERSAWDGAKEQTYLFVREMAKFHDIELAINSKFEKMKLLVQSIAKIHQFEHYGKFKVEYNYRNYSRLLSVINKNNYDVIIAQSSLSMQYLSLISPWFIKKNNIIFVKRGDTIPSFLSRQLKYKVANELVFVSRHVKEAIEKNTLFNQKLNVIESGVDFNQYYPGNDKAGLRSTLGISSKANVFTSVANWDTGRKRQQIILRAFKKLEDPLSKLILVGNGTDREEARSLVKNLNLESKVLLLGFRNDVADILRASDYFLLSSLSEGIAGSLLQAMACGKIVLSTNAGGIKEYLVDGKNGFLVDINDFNGFEKKLVSMTKLDKLTVKDIQVNAIITAKKYSLDNNINHWRQYLDEFMIRRQASSHVKHGPAVN